jgi:hypothetical protein
VLDPSLAKQLRRLVINDRTEWSAVTDKKMNKWNKLYCKYHPAVVKAKWVTGFLPHFQWWDDVQAELGALVKPNSLWFFHRLHLKREAFTLVCLK